MKHIKSFKIFENNINGVEVYHGGGNMLTDDNLLDKPIFTTTDLDAAEWYSDRASDGVESDGVELDCWITKMIVSISNPLTCDNKMDFKNKWIPILDEAGVDYTFGEDDHGWWFESNDIIKNGGYIECNIYDLVFIDEFLEIAKKHGYDGITGYDELSNYDIEIFIPFYKKDIKVISSERFH